MELQYQITKEQLIVPMPKEVDHHIAKTISREIDFIIDSWHVRKLIFDFAETDFMDSSGIGLLSGRNARIACFGGRTIVINANPRIRKLLQIAGLQDQVCIMDEI